MLASTWLVLIFSLVLGMNSEHLVELSSTAASQILAGIK